MSKLIYSSKGTPTHRRFLDANDEPTKFLQPIEGFHNFPLLPLEHAVEPVEHLIPDIQRRVWIAKENSSEGILTLNEAASIHLYTMEWEPLNECLYYVLNATLRTENRQKLVPFFSYLKLVLTALNKLESHSGVFYRGVKLDLSSKYEVDKKYVWWGFTSCTESLEVLESEQFLGRTGTRTLFNVECKNGKSIQPYSYIPNESEILICPATQFLVKSKFSPAQGLHIIHLQEVEPRFQLLQQPSLSSSSSKIAKTEKHMEESVVPKNPKSKSTSSKATAIDVEEVASTQSNLPSKTSQSFFDLSLQIVSPKKVNLIKIDGGDTHKEIRIRTPSDVQLVGRLRNSQKAEIIGGVRVYFDRHKGLWRCMFAPNQNGMFDADILAKRKSDLGNYPFACRFEIQASQIPSPPLSYPKTWQPFYDLDLEVEAPYNCAEIEWPKNASYVEIRMRAPNDVQLSCAIKENDVKIENGSLVQFDSDNRNWQLLFAPQRTGLHQLSVYAKHQSDTNSMLNSAVQFQLNVTQLKQSIKFPKTYDTFSAKKCRILEPLSGTLQKGSTPLFHFLIPGAVNVKIQVDSNWIEKNDYHDPILKSRVAIGSKEVAVYAKYGNKNSYDALVKYTVQ